MANIYVKDIDASASLGEVPAVVGHQVNLGVIQAISGSLLYVANGDQEGWIYSYDCYMSNASGVALFAFPTGSQCISYARSINFPNGFVKDLSSMSGMVYLTDAGPVQFSRPR